MKQQDIAILVTILSLNTVLMIVARQSNNLLVEIALGVAIFAIGGFWIIRSRKDTK